MAQKLVPEAKNGLSKFKNETKSLLNKHLGFFDICFLHILQHFF